MSYTPFAHAESLRIGKVDFSSPDEIKVMLDIEAPESVALNAGGVRPFPRVNSYVLIPVDDAYLVGQIEWLTIEHSAFPQRRGVKDFGLVDLPYPLRKMSLNPLGTLRKKVEKEDSKEDCYIFRRGADALPSIGTAVLLPTENQLRCIVESGEKRHVRIGTSPIAGNAVVSIDPDRLFGRHLAVLGNTGSGKSCSVAGLIRWSLEAAQSKIAGRHPNARFIILDPNGEYARAFSGSDSNLKAKIFKLNPKGNDEKPLQVPMWFWNSAEWVSFTQASTKTQKPTIIQALRFVRDNKTEPFNSKHRELRHFLGTLVTILRIEKNAGNPWSIYPKIMGFLGKIEKFKKGLEPDLEFFDGEEKNKLQKLIDFIEELVTPRKVKNSNPDFIRQEIDSLINLVSQAHKAFGGLDSDMESVDADSPLPFTSDAFMRCVEATAEMMNVSDHVETLLIRLRSLLSDKQMKAVIDDNGSITLEKWLEDYIGIKEQNCLIIIDMSLVPSEIIHIITAVTARMMFEALQRYRKLNGVALPTVLVMEEAHTFIKRYKDDVENYDAATICCQVFERIAREGRKFGLGLVLSSQRPSELSPTVLSQCNSFLLHRISNDRDQELVHRLVPDNLRGLLRELPSLPAQHAILLGWASELPVLLKMYDLPKSQQPHSDDPDFWDVWTGKDAEGKEVERKADWKKVSKDWQNRS
ncbi:MAG: ATP-binding protein [Candidatus Omnitrophota bacterium]